MCPGKPPTLEEVEEECRNRGASFATPYAKGRGKNTPDLPARPLPPAEVRAINEKYLQLKADFDAARQAQGAGTAVAQAEQSIIGQATANHEESRPLTI